MRMNRYIRRPIAFAFYAAMVAALASQAAARPPYEDSPIGWASFDGGTTGGKGGPSIAVADAGALELAVGGQGPATVFVSGRLELTEKIRVGSNKTIVGADDGAEITGYGFHLSRAHNVILRNLSIHDSADDAINIEAGSHHVWIDHCDLSHCHDGLIDIKRGSDLVTVSWCRFHDHHKTCLLGHSDKPAVLAEDKGKLRVTYHHNFFDGTQTRHPRVRIAEPVHVFNNYYRGNEYGVASTDDAGVLVEGNYFLQVKAPTYTQYGDSKAPGRLVERNNLVVESGQLQVSGAVAAVPYKYELDDAAEVPAIVRAGAGVGKLALESRQAR
jgi:pectate lyase